jgi:hypothetical protein
MISISTEVGGAGEARAAGAPEESGEQGEGSEGEQR